MWLLRPPGVYAPQSDTGTLIDELLREPSLPGARVLDVGTGSGAVALAAARAGAADVTAVDISSRAVLAARLNAVLRRVRVRVLRGDLALPVGHRRFEIIVSNPPYVPSPSDRLPHRGPARSWAAGRTGRLLVDRLCAEAPPLLAPGGVLLMVHSGLCGTEKTVAQLEEAGLEAEVTARRTVPYGPVMRRLAPWLEAGGLVEPGQEHEELVVVRAVRSR
ncbi:HemK2/MTQ2 family protein methyltransferase [Streptomyces sp. HB2AG]|uniref:HemK2/MTQ2 family protein methyltransferase n=1 Tax=Streptomyces sp. HB2AG TaxID=2983400 RepID=UPI0022AB2E07|nr:HemK2/MTQ2 family protein methyltransferase [Streptomyces sp. HB2AG]MCZ2526403.1 methyltransferase [Streptomyces sp. HB2AG]